MMVGYNKPVGPSPSLLGAHINSTQAHFLGRHDVRGLLSFLSKYSQSHFNSITPFIQKHIAVTEPTNRATNHDTYETDNRGLNARKTFNNKIIRDGNRAGECMVRERFLLVGCVFNYVCASVMMINV